MGFLSSAVPSSTVTDSLDYILTLNRRILEYSATPHLGIKQYLPHYRTQGEWRAHFGSRWQVFLQRKSSYDPLAILAPGQRIFQKAMPILWDWNFIWTTHKELDIFGADGARNCGFMTVKSKCSWISRTVLYRPSGLSGNFVETIYGSNIQSAHVVNRTNDFGPVRD